MKYDYLIFIGRFQPFHTGHESVIRKALQLSDKVIVLVGSAYQPRTVRNPWDFNERESFMRLAFSEEENRRILAFPLLDQTYNNQLWIKSVQLLVSGVVHNKIASKPKVGLIGHQKDNTSDYLTQFPQWEREEVENYENISSTDIRELYFDDQEFTNPLNSNIAMALEKFKKTKAFEEVQNEFYFVKKYKSAWDKAPYTPMFITVDAVVVQSGHILLIERKAQPGKGLMALPGGFLDGNETLKTAVIRELREETRIKVPAPVLAGSITKQEVFDNPHRSARGRTVTHAYLIELKGESLPKVKGGDDAAKAFWVPFAEVKPEMMFEDHFHIIQAMVG
ncbi:MAG: Nicotinamide-nucleotide adenylyltransferase, NadM family (EC / ADP-ribose pyrophosphatase (EC [uncultured Sulfurovum sp.]|uniref:Nicotinamide-nucleotide adenylyltransferase, NadM family ) n=1 Tax=uncultured Sulfurovum sp. TaxID=269237 RepID=A0A6S6TGX8_9BACT|nr:MAG: Nicotinamide-nucleotide adenylyltransferase, NadM family (EC / ADP-ribose pyrophosphatase (EC [uncultured Sulfurovum sp.]